MADITGVKNLEEHLTCALCLEQYTDPVILPCHHVFCKACLQPVIQMSEDSVFLCPDCRSESSRDAVQTAFMINALKDVYEKLEEERKCVSLSSETERPAAPQAAEFCGRHRSQSLDLYCRDCNVLVCRDCLLDVTNKQHSEHQYIYINKLAGNFREKITEKLTTVQELGAKLRAAVELVSLEKALVDEQEVNITKITNKAYERIIQVFEEEKVQTLGQLSKIVDQKRMVLKSQEQTLKMASDEVNKELEHLSDALSMYSDQRLIKYYSTLKTDFLVETMEMLSFDPLEAADVGGLTPIDEDVIRKACKSATFHHMASVGKTQVAGEGVRSAITNKPAHFGVKLYNAYSNACVAKQDVAVQLKSLRNGLITDADVSIDSEHPSRYLVRYTVETGGHYDLDVLVNGEPIPQCPLSLRIKKPPYQTWMRCVEISTLEKPTRLAMVGEMLYVSEFGADRVSIFNNKLEMMRRIDNLQGPGNIASDNDANMYICTTADHRVHKIAADDTVLASVGGHGRASDEFSTPNGACFHNQKLYVCDSENYRIKVYDSDLNLLETHDNKVMGFKRRNFACDLAVDSQGFIYMVDSHNHRINVFDENWKQHSTIGKRGSGPGELQTPMCIHIDEDDQIFVSEYDNNRISVFNTLGHILATFGQRYLTHPEGLTVDQDGFVYVSHSQQNIAVFC